MTTSHPTLSPTPAGSVLDGDPRILIPLPEAAARLGISRWQAYKLGRSGSACASGGAAPHRTRRPPPSPRAGGG